MSETLARKALSELRSAARGAGLYPDGHPALVQGARNAADAMGDLTRGIKGEVVLTMLGDSIYLGRELLAHASLEFNGLLRDAQRRGIESISFYSTPTTGDVVDVASLLAGISDDYPAEGTIRLNERVFAASDLEEDRMYAGLRRSYARSLDVLRGIAMAAAIDQDFDLSGASWAVEQLVEQTIAQPASALLLTNLKSHDEYTFYHSVNVCILSIAMGRLVGLDEARLHLLGVGGLLHDIGKVKVPASTLQHPGRLDPIMWEEIKLHPVEGAEAILAAASHEEEAAAIVAFEHHARFDAEGYPHIAYRKELHLFSRLVSAADAYDAITTRRSYRRAETPNRALGLLSQSAGSHFDPDVVTAFRAMMGEFPPGSLLQLEDGSVAMVTSADGQEEVPEALLVRTAAGELLAEPEPVALEGREIIDELSADSVGVDPASLLERAGGS